MRSFDPLEIRSRSVFITLGTRGGRGFYSRGVSIHLVWPGVASNSRLQLHQPQPRTRERQSEWEIERKREKKMHRRDKRVFMVINRKERNPIRSRISPRFHANCCVPHVRAIPLENARNLLCDRQRVRRRFCFGDISRPHASETISYAPYIPFYKRWFSIF